MISKIKALFRMDITLDWEFGKSQLDTLAETLRREATTVSTLALRLTKRVHPLAWRKHLPIPSEDQQPINAIINLIKNRKIKHLILEGDVDLMSVPNIGTMDFTNLDILSIMKTNLQPGRVGPTQDEYIPELVSFLQPCNFLTELSLGFPDSIPGHVRILQACIAGLSRLRRLDLFRVLGNKSYGNESKGGTAINRKLELSASVSSARVTRLYMAECKATGESKVRLQESLEELLMDEGSYLEDLELYSVGFGDKLAHALEFGTRPISGHDHCRLRRLIIHGNGLELGGILALKQVLKRATKSDQRSAPQENGGNAASSSSSLGMAVTATADENPESLSFGTMREQTTLMHLELRSMDTLTDHDWASLLNESNLQHLVTLDLQGVGFGDRAMKTLARTGHTQDSDSTSPPASPADESSSLASTSVGSLLPTAPPAFFSSSAPLRLQTLGLSSSALSHKGVEHMQEFLSRLIRLSTLSLHGFRKVTSEHWVDILARISFRRIEVFEIVSLGFDDDCLRYLCERIKSRERAQEIPSLTSATDEVSQADLPTYHVRPSVDSTLSVATTSSISTSSSSGSPSTLRNPRRESFSSRLHSTMSGLSTRQRPGNNTDPAENIPSSPSRVTASTPGPTPSQKYLEIDLRYTDVTSNGLTLLRADMIGQAKRVFVHTRDGENENDNEKELARLTAKLKEDKDSEKYKRNGKDRVNGSFGGAYMYSGTGISPAAVLLPSAISSYHSPGSGHGHGGGSSTNINIDSNQQTPQPTKVSAFTKMRKVFGK